MVHRLQLLAFDIYEDVGSKYKGAIGTAHKE